MERGDGTEPGTGGTFDPHIGRNVEDVDPPEDSNPDVDPQGDDDDDPVSVRQRIACTSLARCVEFMYGMDIYEEDFSDWERIGLPGPPQNSEECFEAIPQVVNAGMLTILIERILDLGAFRRTNPNEFVQFVIENKIGTIYEIFPIQLWMYKDLYEYDIPKPLYFSIKAVQQWLADPEERDEDHVRLASFTRGDFLKYMAYKFTPVPDVDNPGPAARAHVEAQRAATSASGTQAQGTGGISRSTTRRSTLEAARRQSSIGTGSGILQHLKFAVEAFLHVSLVVDR